MIIDTEFNKGDNVCYFDGNNIHYSTIREINIEISSTIIDFIMVYKLSDGLNVSRNNYPKWDRKLFKDKESLIKYLEEGK